MRRHSIARELYSSSLSKINKHQNANREVFEIRENSWILFWLLDKGLGSNGWQVHCLCGLLWLRLDLSWSVVTLGGDTSNWLGLLGNEDLVGGLLPLLVHGSWWWLCEETSSGEESEGNGNTNHGVAKDLDTLSWRSLRAWAVWAESNPVCGLLLLEGQLSPVGLHSVAEGHPEISLLLWWHALPSLLDIGEGWVGDGVGETLLDDWGLDEGRARGSADNRGAQHDDN